MKSDIDIYVINAVRKRRETLGISQEALSYRIGRCGSFIGNIESGTRKYSILHLNLIALELKCSIRDFFPEQPLTERKSY